MRLSSAETSSQSTTVTSIGSTSFLWHSLVSQVSRYFVHRSLVHTYNDHVIITPAGRESRTYEMRVPTNRIRVVVPRLMWLVCSLKPDSSMQRTCIVVPQLALLRVVPCWRAADDTTAIEDLPLADGPTHILLTSSAVTSLKAWTGTADLMTSRVAVRGAMTQLSLVALPCCRLLRWLYHTNNNYYCPVSSPVFLVLFDNYCWINDRTNNSLFFYQSSLTNCQLRRVTGTRPR